MTISYAAIGDAIAARYAPGQVATPSGADAIRSSSADLPNQVGATPCFLISPDAGTLEIPVGGTRLGVTDWFARLYYAQTAGGDLERDSGELMDYLDVLTYQHQTGITLGGLVVWTRTVGWSVGELRYGGLIYNGLELRIRTRTSESWTATA